MCELSAFETLAQNCGTVLAILFTRRKNFNLSYMSVSTRMLVLQNSYLYVHGFYVAFWVLIYAKFERVPAIRLIEFYHSDFLHLLEAILDFNANLLRRIGLISLKI